MVDAKRESGKTVSALPTEWPWDGYDTSRVRDALRVTAGIIAGVDREALIHDLMAQRKQGHERG